MARLSRSYKYLDQDASFKSLCESRVVGVTLGNFDGMHRGHAALFESLFETLDILSKRLNKNPFAALMSFYPHPRVYFARKKYRLQNAEKNLDQGLKSVNLSVFSERFRLAEKLGFDLFLAQRFNREFASLSASRFVDEVIVKTFNAQLVVVGDDWHFGARREGDPETLKELGNQRGFSVEIIDSQNIENQRISTGTIKRFIENGLVDKAEVFLGRAYQIVGRVIRGAARGRKIGIPTLNLMPVGQLLPGNGVYVTQVEISKQWYNSVTNIGIRPTFINEAEVRKVVVESHVLDSGDLGILYGEKVRIRFLTKIREERRFSSVEELIAAIKRDIRYSLKYFNDNTVEK